MVKGLYLNQFCTLFGIWTISLFFTLCSAFEVFPYFALSVHSVFVVNRYTFEDFVSGSTPECQYGLGPLNTDDDDEEEEEDGGGGGGDDDENVD